MARQRLRIFVSSPGDVMAAREVAAQIIEKVAHEYARFFDIEPYLWEYEPMLASGHFQDSIDPPSRFDAVILILESRLGTPMPERTAVREYRGMDGRTPVTGTEWEFEDALAAARARGLPDLLVYRSQRHAEVNTWDLQSQEAVLAQLKALNAFWSRHFADRGTFIGGYATFQTLEEFAGKLEQDLRSCVQRRAEALKPEQRAERVRLWPSAPFRGLEAYEFEHAPIFFGREEAIGAALLRLVTNAQAGRPFLLVLGASGSGKSSLVKAGVLPRLLVPQRVSGVAFLRRAVFRPGDAQPQEDLFEALARRLTEGDGESTGLPELLGASMSVKELARHLRESTTHPDLPFAMVLDRLAETAREQGRMLRYEQPRLILEVDQLEELFTSERVQPEERRRFVQLLASLVRSNLLWLIATMRSDFWHRAVETPELVELADGQGRLDLLPPSPSELSQMLRGPAEAAAIHFETNAATGIPLNDLIAQEAAGEPGALPLLSYLLDQLYQRDIQEGGGDTLAYASYNALGGLKGAIATRADAVVAAQPPEVQQALRSVLFALVQMSAAEGSVERAVARRAPLSDFPAGTAKRRLIEALTDPAARLLVADSMTGHAATVRLAHEALINEWQTARNYVAGNAEALKIRRMLEERYARWQKLSSESRGAGRTRTGALISAVRSPFALEHGLLTDVDLTDAQRLLQHYGEDLPRELTGYIERSIEQDRRRHRRALRVATAAAVVLGLLALGAVYEARVASAQREAALQAQQRSLTQTAAARLNNSDVPAAEEIILQVLTDRSGARQYTPGALSVFQEVRAADAQVLAATGHSNWLYFVAYSPDGRRIVTSSSDKTARIWDAVTGQQLLVLSGHTEMVSSAGFSPDGQKVVTSSADKTARIWDATSGQQLRVLTGHGDRVTSAAFSPDGRRILTASRDKTVRVWDAASLQQLLVLSGHTASIATAVYSLDGRRIVSASLDKTARVWDAVTGHQLTVLSGHTALVGSAAFSPDGERVVTASFDRTARIWDAATGRQLLVLSGHPDFVLCAAFSPDGQNVVTTSYDKTARIWDAANGKQLRVMSGHAGYVVRAAFSPDGREIASASTDQTARIWNVVSPRQLLVLRHSGVVGSAAFSPDGRRIITAVEDSTAHIWDSTSGRELLILRGHTGWVEDVAYSPDGQRIATASSDKTARVWDSGSGQQLLVLNGHTDRVANAEWSPDGRRIVTSSHDKTARIWDASSGEQLLVLTHGTQVGTVEFSPDGRSIVTSSYDRAARTWDAVSGRQLLVLTGHTDVVDTADFSPDGRRIITSSQDGTARIWDSATGRQLLVLNGHTDAVSGAAYSRDGRHIVTASNDKTARIWDAVSGQQLLVLSGHADRLVSAAFSPEGTRVVTTSIDATARVWDAHVAALPTQVEWAEAAQLDSLSSAEGFQLGLPAATDVRHWPPAPSKCDEAAAAPYDPVRRAAGVTRDDIVADVALAECAQDRTSSSPSLYQHGRALMAKGSFADARQDLERALAAGYHAAGIDLAMLLSEPAAGMPDLPRAISLYEQSWKDGVTIAAFELGTLYEHGVTKDGTDGGYLLAPDQAKAWTWYERGAVAGEPTALARFGEKEDRAALTADKPADGTAHLLQAFHYYASALERARLEDWPEDAWRDWRYRRASIARVLAEQGMMEPVAEAYASVRNQYAPARSVWQRLASAVGMD